MRFRWRDYAYPARILGYRRLMQDTSGWSVERMARWSLDQRQRILQHAVSRVPYYRTVLAGRGIQPEDAATPEGWLRLPLLEKSSLRTAGREMLAEGLEQSGVWATTSGSTGQPTSIFLDRNVNAAAFALFWRAWGTEGYWRLGQRQASLKGMVTPEGWRYNRPIRTLELSATRLGPETVGAYREAMLRYRPRFLRGYPSAIYLFCRLLRQQSLSLRVPMVISGAETLHRYQRAEIESVLGARVFNHYTHWERAASILECPAGRLHAQEDYAHHEILGPDGTPAPPGTPGEIVVTGLHNLAMPLIRYRTGDLAAWSPLGCSCGLPFPLVERIFGRETDYVVTPSGRLLTGTAVSWGEDVARALYYQIIQRQRDALEIRIVPGEGFEPAEDVPRAVRLLAERIGEPMRIEVRLCRMEELERSPAGKLREFFNRIPPADLGETSIPFPSPAEPES